MHGERRTCRLVIQSIGAVIELVAVGLTIVGDAEPKLLEATLLDKGTLLIDFDENAFFAETDASELFARTEKPRIIITRSLNHRKTFTLITYDFLRQHVMTGHQAIGRQSLKSEPAFTGCEAPMSIDWVVVPLPLEAKRGREVVRGLRQEDHSRWNGFFP